MPGGTGLDRLISGWMLPILVTILIIARIIAFMFIRINQEGIITLEFPKLW
jgi:hypothetical protein